MGHYILWVDKSDVWWNTISQFGCFVKLIPSTKQAEKDG
jgi:hypothetical protein